MLVREHHKVDELSLFVCLFVLRKNLVQFQFVESKRTFSSHSVLSQVSNMEVGLS